MTVKMKCPLCTIYGLDSELEEVWQDETKHYICKGDMKHDLCEHILKATKKDLNNFACQNCSSSIDECDCYDCNVFCSQCNGFVFVSCSDVISIMDSNDLKESPSKKAKEGLK